MEEVAKYRFSTFKRSAADPDQRKHGIWRIAERKAGHDDLFIQQGILYARRLIRILAAAYTSSWSFSAIACADRLVLVLLIDEGWTDLNA